MTTQPFAWQLEVQRLASLPPIEYDRQRKSVAKALKCNVTTLDSEVKKARGGGDLKSAGRAFEPRNVEPWPDPVDGAALLDHLASLFEQYARLPPHGGTLLALWTLFTYVFDEFDVCPLLLLSSPEKGCGKTTVLSLVGRLVHRPLLTSNISPAAVFRVVEKWRPTLLIDEADSFLRDNEELRGILNSGHTRDAAFVVRNVGDDHEPHRFSTWCPKALAGIGKRPGTIEDRGLKLSLQRKKAGDKTQRLRNDTGFGEVQRKCVRWALDHGSALPGLPDYTPEFLDNRAADNWLPLFAIATAVGGAWPQRCEQTARSLATIEQDDSIGCELLRDVRAAFESSKTDKLKTERLIELLCTDPESRWNESRKGYPINARQLAKLLKGYGIASKTIRLPDGNTPKGYERAQFEEAFTRYLPDFAATTPQANNNQASKELHIRHNAPAVADPNIPEMLVPPALWRCGGSEGEITGAHPDSNVLDAHQTDRIIERSQ